MRTLKKQGTTVPRFYICLSAAHQLLLSKRDNGSNNCIRAPEEDVGHLHALITAKVVLLLI